MRHTELPPTQSPPLAEPREARRSGEIRVAPDGETGSADDLGSSSALPISRLNADVRVLPSVFVDASYLQAVSSVERRARRRDLALAAVGAFVFGMVAMSLTEELTREPAAPMTASAPPSSQGKHVGASREAPLAPTSAFAASPYRARMDQHEAARLVRDAQTLRSERRLRDARRLLAEVLTDRSGYPAGLAAMAELELDCGRVAAAVRWARLAVRALPSSTEHRELLRRAETAAGLPAESARTHVR